MNYQQLLRPQKISFIRSPCSMLQPLVIIYFAHCLTSFTTGRDYSGVPAAPAAEGKAASGMASITRRTWMS